ncbi:hypothetical protein BDV27DRAFT_170522 [Aspergillus caelatus]|uniref:Uncharacterized protein n=2 Tax=Aspergillus subgen. Circumdati TaxID=2720871 RepID=A0A5N6ZKE4_9EURO|nr:uncharacterized protein BDV27DRAFT_170522 [Aspergillus caelatus]KAE8357436.1 hypothetical protein BDV27DRAFT_170522 [Aspergillus caelatus]KAE8410255.1 hypothetical protein BDV36DRAFT_302920 [Aspergillus pseudocaelatus]
MATSEDIKNEIYKLSVSPFILERRGDYDKAIEIHKSAIDVLGAAAEKLRKSSNVRKINRKMFERQVELHRERFAYLKCLKHKGSYEGITLPPTVLDVMQELERDDGDNNPWTLSQIRKALHDYSKETPTNTEPPSQLKPFLDAADSTKIPLFVPTLPSSAETVIYRLSHSSELIELGVRSHWWFVKDSANKHTLYALQAVWSQNVPIVEAILRRAGEFLPQMGAVNIKIRKTKGGAFRLVTSTVPQAGHIVEIPDGEAQRKDWSPRRFKYGGRNFVWKSGRAGGKSADGGLFRSFSWETLYETKRVWPKEGSRTGKMEDETVGPRLCWGEKGGGNGAVHSIYMVGGLDLQFREHLLASQLARLVRCSNPPQKDSAGVEMVSAGESILSLAEWVS